MKRILIPLFSTIFALISCDDTTDSIGSSLTDYRDQLNVTTKVFGVISESTLADSVSSRTSTGYLGKVKDPETNNSIACNFMTQFHTYISDTLIAAKEKCALLDENQNALADSCVVQLFYKSFYGDSLAVMNCTMHELDHHMEEGKTFYSDFSPKANGYLRGDDGIHMKKSYTVGDQSVLVSSSNMHFIKFRLDEEYTDKEGTKHSNYGSYLLSSFHNHPEYWKTPYQFIKNVCPGFYFETTGGIGSMTYVYVSQITLYYQAHTTINGKDSIIHISNNFCGTEEVMQNNDVTQDKASLAELANDASSTYIKSPAGIFTRVTLPVDSIMRDWSDVSTYKLRQDTLNTARMTIKRLNNTYTGNYTLPTPSTLLMLQEDLRYSFFKNNEVTDGKKSTLIGYSSSTNGYSFTNISKLIITAAREKLNYIQSHPGTTSEQYNALFPNWNKFLLIPVTTSYATVGSSSVLTKVTHDMSLGSTRLERGTEDSPISVSVIYTKFSDNK